MNEEDLFITETAKEMEQTLRSSRLEVCVKDGRRVVTSQNTQWYRHFCKRYERLHKSKYRTIIKRCHTLTALKRLQHSNYQGVYADRLMQIIEVYWGTYGPPINHP